MQAGHLLLQRPWQFDQCVQHDGFTNKYSFKHNQRTITLVPMTPKQVYEDQVRLQQWSEQKKLRDQKKESEKIMRLCNVRVRMKTGRRIRPRRLKLRENNVISIQQQVRLSER